MSNSPPLSSQLDHLVICAHQLSAGVAWFEHLSDVKLPIGGSHPLMGTHNHLTALSKNEFLEIIATDPTAATPSRKRWFNLDNEDFQSRLKVSPCLTTWVLGTRDLEAALAAVRSAGIDAGQPIEQTRDDLRWNIAIRDDGTLACDGVFPILIQWPESVNPVGRMQDQGLRLTKVRLRHPRAAQIRKALSAIGLDHPVDLDTGDAAVHAEICIGKRNFQLYLTISVVSINQFS